MIDDINGIVCHRPPAPADVIVMRSDRDVFVAQFRIAATDHRHDVARRILGRKLVEARRRCDRSADGADFRAVNARTEQSLCHRLTDVQERWQLRIALALQELIRLTEDLNHLRRHHLEARDCDTGGIGKLPSDDSTVDAPA